MSAGSSSRVPSRVSTRAVMVGLLLAALLVAGVASYYASAHPDGLEHVAEQTGFLDSADDSPTADGPLADYQVDGVDDERLSGGLAGVLGVLLVLVLMGGLGWLLRRRGPDAETDGAAEATDAPAPTGRS